jgi:hypothetical protein
MIVGGRPVNPLKFQNPPARPLEDDRRPALEASMREWRPILDAIDPQGPSTALARTAGGSGSGAGI